MTDSNQSSGEREAIVKWLERWIDDTLGQDVSPQYLIDAIERGDHIGDKHG